MSDQETLEMALIGYQLRRQTIQQKIRDIETRLSGRDSASGAGRNAATRSGRRQMSAEAKRRIAEAQKKRWAEYRAKHQKSESSKSESTGKKAETSDAGQKRAILKARAA